MDQKNIDKGQISWNKNFFDAFFSKKEITEYLKGIPLIILLTSPANVIKVRKQTQTSMLKSGFLTQQYKGYGDIVKRIFTQEGIQGFWKGNLLNMHNSIIPLFPLFFLNQTINLQIPFVFYSFILGIYYPCQEARIRLMTNTINPETGKKYYANLKEVIGKSFAQNLRGFSAFYLQYAIGYFVFKAVREIPETSQWKELEEMKQNFLKGALLYLCIPTYYFLDTVKNRMIMSSREQFDSTKVCIQNIFKREGIRGFYKGFGISSIIGIFYGTLILPYVKIEEKKTEWWEDKNS